MDFFFSELARMMYREFMHNNASGTLRGGDIITHQISDSMSAFSKISDKTKYPV